MKNVANILIFVACAGLFSQCANDGEYEHPINADNFPEVPILFTGTTSFGANPFYQVKFVDSANPNTNPQAVSVTLAVGGESGRTIKEITKVLVGPTGITPGNIITSTTVNFLPGVLAVNGTTVTINTTVGALNTYIAGTANDITQARVDLATTSTPATPYIEAAFLFWVTLDDNSSVISQQVRIRFVK